MIYGPSSLLCFVDEAAIMEQRGRFGGIRMVWCLWPGIQTSPCPWQKVECPPLVLTAWGGRTWAWQRDERPLLVVIAWDGRTCPPLILTVLGGRTRAHLDNSSQASSPYLNCVGWQDKPTLELSTVLDVALYGCHNLDTLWSPQSGQFTILMFPLWRSNIASSWSVLCIWDIALFWRCQTGLVFVLLCHCGLVDRIKENNKMVIVGLRLVSSQTRLLPTMTLYSTIIRVYFIVQLKK